jgi:hypothetical protein
MRIGIGMNKNNTHKNAKTPEDLAVILRLNK